MSPTPSGPVTLPPRHSNGTVSRAAAAATLVVAALVTPMAPARAQAPSAPSPLARYTVRPISTDSLVHLRVTVRFAGEADGETRFALPDDRFGVAEMHRSVRGLGASPAGAPPERAGDEPREVRLEETDPGVYAVRHAPGAEIAISYTIAYDPARADFLAFGPSVGPDQFHFFGSQWMARVGPAEGLRRIEVVFDDGAWGPPLGSSFGVGRGPHRVAAEDYDLDYSVIAGGAYRTARSTCRGRPVAALLRADLTIPDPDVFSMVERIVCGQREAFDDFDRPFFTVFITEREGLRAGAPVLNGFTAFVDGETTRRDLRELLAHEMIHTWLPRTARLVDPARPDAGEARTRWFHEGFTEYLARLVLVRQGLERRAWMVDRTNRDLERLAYHPYRTLTLDELESASRDGRYTSLHHRLHYLRGALLALKWDARIRTASAGEHSLLDAVKRIVERAVADGGQIAVGELHRIFSGFGVDARRDIERHLEGGEGLAPDASAFGPEYGLTTRSVPRFTPGFDLRAFIEDDRIARLVPGGAGERAGLREGMEVVDAENAAPWRGSWDPAAPLVLVVDEDGNRRSVEVPAAGPRIEIPFFSPRDSVPPTPPRTRPGW